MKINRIKTNLTVVTDEGDLLTSNNCTDEMYNAILEAENTEEVKAILVPEFYKKLTEAEEKLDAFETLKDSKILTVFGNSVYIKFICELTVPLDLAFAIVKAEKEGNQELLQSYISFWTLCSLNPDSRARTNLFWFLNKYGMTISKSGLFIAYRNVRVKSEGSTINLERSKAISSEYVRIKFKSKKAPSKYSLCYFEDGTYKARKTRSNLNDFMDWISDNEVLEVVGNLEELYEDLKDVKKTNTIYTDSYSGKFTITLGNPVTMDRDLCDADQDRTCSKGLHVAGKEWLVNQGGSYFGTVSVLCLVNPADVVAVPPSDTYGKMRTCCYYPVRVVSNTEKLGNDIETYDDGFEDDFMEIISYQGEVNQEDETPYRLEVPEIPELNSKKVFENLSKISKSLKKVVEND